MQYSLPQRMQTEFATLQEQVNHLSDRLKQAVVERDHVIAALVTSQRQLRMAEEEAQLLRQQIRRLRSELVGYGYRIAGSRV